MIGNFLLHPDYFYLYGDPGGGGPRRSCVVQIGDVATNTLPKSVGFSSRDPEVALIPDPQFWAQRGYVALREKVRLGWVPWRERQPQAFWRGSTTGTLNLTMQTLLDLPRFRLCGLSKMPNGVPGTLDAKITNVVQARNPADADQIRSYLQNLGLFAPAVAQTAFMNFRYLIDIDGNSNSWSLLAKLLMGACVLKVTSDFRQWYYEGLVAWKHFVPVRSDLTDLEERLAWCLDNDEKARAIAEDGRSYANGLVYGTQMFAAAGTILRSSLASGDER